MSQAIVVGLTGGIGCGKSVVGETLESLGLRRLDTDKVARDVVAPGSPGLAEIAAVFGATILTENGELDRLAMGRLVFSDAKKRRRLEQILHPLIWSEVTRFIADCRRDNRHGVVEVPLLFENGRQESFDTVWVVATTPQMQAARLTVREGWSADEVEARISSQMPLSEKLARADTVIWNNGTVEELRRQVADAWLRECG